MVITRYFAAPRELVFDCHTKPELMRRWLTGPEGWVLERLEQDAKTGGKYLYVYADPNTNKMGVYGTFLEVIVPEIVANTENYAMDMSAFDPNAPEDPNATVESRTFTTQDAGTLLTHVARYASAEVRQIMLDGGACDGWPPLFQQLDQVLREIG